MIRFTESKKKLCFFNITDYSLEQAIIWNRIGFMQWVIKKNLNAVKRFKESEMFEFTMKYAAAWGNLEILKLFDGIIELDFQLLR